MRIPLDSPKFAVLIFLQDIFGASCIAQHIHWVLKSIPLTLSAYMEEWNSHDDKEYALISKSKLLVLKRVIEDYVKEHDAIKKDLEKLRKIKS
jgi:hypothetical protein